MPARIWFAMDAMFTHDPAIQRLGMDHGPAGPLAIAHLLGVAKLHDDDGAFEIHWLALAQAVYVADVSSVRKIVSQASALGFLELTREDDKTFAGRFPGWNGWQPNRQLARDRQARYAGRKQKADDSLTPRTSAKRQVADGFADAASVSTVTGTDTEEEPKGSSIGGEHEDFPSWLAHHEQITDQRPPREGTKARAKVAGMYGARRSEGYSAEDACLATLGAFNDPYRRENGHYGCESVLRPEKIHDLVEKGRRGPRVVAVAKHPADVRDAELAALAEQLRQGAA